MSQPPVQPPVPPPYGAPSPYGGPYGGPYGESGYQPPASRAMANWALALSLLICIPFGFLVAIGLAIAVLVRSRDGRDHGRGTAIVALVIATIWFVVQVGLVAFLVFKGVTEGVDAPRDSQGNITESTEITVGNLRVGDCFNDKALLGATGNDAEGVTARAMPCAQPHTFEVFHTFELPGDDYPGNDRAFSLGEAGCAAQVRDFLGGRPPRGSQLAIYLYYPQERAWSLLGNHTIQCVIGQREPLTGSLRGTGR